MTPVPQPPQCEVPASAARPTAGVAVGHEGQAVLRIEEQGWRESAGQTMEGREVLNELLDMYSRTQHVGWDGYGAKAISEATFNRAYAFLRSLPVTLPRPEVVPEPTGTIAFEWQRAPNVVFSVSIQDGYPVAYAGLFGLSKTFGTEWFISEFPRSLLQHIGRVFPEETQKQSA
jgi:hypothetical protein